MQKCLLFGIIFSILTIESSLSINRKRFYSSVEDSVHMLQGKNHISKESIKIKSSFLDDGDLLNPELIPKQCFGDLYYKIWENKKRTRLLRFAKYCKDFYDEGDNLTQLSVRLLLIEVSNKYIKWKDSRATRKARMKAVKREDKIQAILEDKPYPAPINMDSFDEFFSPYKKGSSSNSLNSDERLAAFFKQENESNKDQTDKK